jgi:hypothetical protein
MILLYSTWPQLTKIWKKALHIKRRTKDYCKLFLMKYGFGLQTLARN